MKCSSCHRDLQPKDTYCKFCGTPTKPRPVSGSRSANASFATSAGRTGNTASLLGNSDPAGLRIGKITEGSALEEADPMPPIAVSVDDEASLAEEPAAVLQPQSDLQTEPTAADFGTKKGNIPVNRKLLAMAAAGCAVLALIAVLASTPGNSAQKKEETKKPGLTLVYDASTEPTWMATYRKMLQQAEQSAEAAAGSRSYDPLSVPNWMHKAADTFEVPAEDVQEPSRPETAVTVPPENLPRQEVPEDAQSSESDSEYLLPESNVRPLTDEDLEPLTHEELCFARNEIYARHGWIFSVPEIATFFADKSWYQGTTLPAYFNSNVLNDIEKRNISFITEYEAIHYGGSYY